MQVNQNSIEECQEKEAKLNDLFQELILSCKQNDELFLEKKR